MIESFVHPEKKALDHIEERVRSLLRFDMIRIMQLLESLQFGMGYLIIGFIIGISLDWSFPVYSEDEKLSKVFKDVVFQSILLIIAVFYSRKIVKIMPFLFVIGQDGNKYKPYQASEYSGEIMISLALIGTQFNLVKKLDFLSRQIYQFFFNEERKVGQSLGI